MKNEWSRKNLLLLTRGYLINKTLVLHNGEEIMPLLDIESHPWAGPPYLFNPIIMDVDNHGYDAGRV